MRARGLGKRIGAADLDLQNTAFHQIEELGGSRAHAGNVGGQTESAGRETDSEPRLASCRRSSGGGWPDALP